MPDDSLGVSYIVCLSQEIRRNDMGTPSLLVPWAWVVGLCGPCPSTFCVKSFALYYCELRIFLGLLLWWYSICYA